MQAANLFQNTLKYLAVFPNLGSFKCGLQFLEFPSQPSCHMGRTWSPILKLQLCCWTTFWFYGSIQSLGVGTYQHGTFCLLNLTNNSPTISTCYLKENYIFRSAKAKENKIKQANRQKKILAVVVWHCDTILSPMIAETISLKKLKFWLPTSHNLFYSPLSWFLPFSPFTILQTLSMLYYSNGKPDMHVTGDIPCQFCWHIRPPDPLEVPWEGLVLIQSLQSVEIMRAFLCNSLKLHKPHQRMTL